MTTGVLASLFVPSSRTYVITLNAIGLNVDAINRYLMDSKDIEAFWNYIPLIYFVRTRLSATELAQRLDPFIPSKLYVVAEVNPSNVDGRQPPESWDWFYKARTPATHGNALAPPTYPPTPSSK